MSGYDCRTKCVICVKCAQDQCKPECQQHSWHDAADEMLLQSTPRQQEHLCSSEIQPKIHVHNCNIIPDMNFMWHAYSFASASSSSGEYFYQVSDMDLSSRFIPISYHTSASQIFQTPLIRILISVCVGCYVSSLQHLISGKQDSIYLDRIIYATLVLL